MDYLNLQNRLGLIKIQRKYYHISNIRAFKRIGTHNEEVLSNIIRSLLGDASANNRTGERVINCYPRSRRHK
jgi:hypothetical protein